MMCDVSDVYCHGPSKNQKREINFIDCPALNKVLHASKKTPYNGMSFLSLRDLELAAQPEPKPFPSDTYELKEKIGFGYVW